MKPLYLVAAVLLLAGSAYIAGRCNAPGKQDAITASLLDGIKGYEKQNAELRRQLAAGHKQIVALGKQRTPVPALVPAGCEPFAANLSTCDQQLEATGHLLALSEKARAEGKARDDSLAAALKKAHRGDYFLGLVKLPSRTTSLGLGGLLGGGACLLLRH